MKKVFYVGNCRTPDRLELLVRIYDKLHKVMECEFYLVGVDKNAPHRDGILYNQPLSYEEVLEKSMDSYCVLELINDNQSGNTLRYKEAVCLNKRILTNNSKVKTDRYYNSEFVHCFENVDDIDLEWLTTDYHIDYKYEGDYSPSLLLNMIEEEADKKWS